MSSPIILRKKYGSIESGFPSGESDPVPYFNPATSCFTDRAGTIQAVANSDPIRSMRSSLNELYQTIIDDGTVRIVAKLISSKVMISDTDATDLLAYTDTTVTAGTTEYTSFDSMLAIRQDVKSQNTVIRRYGSSATNALHGMITSAVNTPTPAIGTMAIRFKPPAGSGTSRTNTTVVNVTAGAWYWSRVTIDSITNTYKRRLYDASGTLVSDLDFASITAGSTAIVNTQISSIGYPDAAASNDTGFIGRYYELKNSLYSAGQLAAIIANGP